MMQKIENIRDIQRLEYNILSHVIDFFEEQDISYILSGGTMLGAVRHKGFIPWDDDIDVRVLRDDYERLKVLVRDGTFQSDFIEFWLPGDEGYYYPFIKATDNRTRALEGLAATSTRIWVDIFPLDHYPDGKIKHMVTFSGIKLRDLLLTGRIVVGSKAHPPLKRIAAVFLSMLCKLFGGPEAVAGNIDRCAKKMNAKYRTSSHVGDGTWPVGMQDYFLTEWIFPTIPQQFEKRNFMIPHAYHEYLTQFYGDYMKLPPESKRERQHRLQVWWMSEEEMDAIVEI